MRYLVLMGVGFLAFGLFGISIGIKSGGDFGGDYWMGIGILVSVMGAIMLLLFLKTRRNSKEIAS